MNFTNYDANQVSFFVILSGKEVAKYSIEMKALNAFASL